MLNRPSSFASVCIFIALLLTLGACDPSNGETAPAGETESVPVYFLDGHGLTAVYKELSGKDITLELFSLIKQGPGDRDELRSFVPDDAELVATTETESDESLRLELDDAFWELPPGERFAAAAQIAYTYASLEEGKRLLLLDGTVPGELQDGNGELVEQPLTAESFGDLAPWVQVQQPVAGATVRHSFPLVTASRPGTEGTVEIFVDEESVVPAVGLEETTVIDVEPALSGDIIVRITMTDEDGGKHITELPLHLAG